MRRDKMDRLRRKFGDDVPVDLVFPREKVRSRKHQRSDAVNVITIPADSRIPHSPQHTVMIKTSTVSRKTQPSLKGSGPLSSIIESAELGVESGEQQGLLGPRRRPTAGSSIGSKEYLAHRRQKMNGHPAIEPVGFLGTTF
ncbi:hypothetical protein SERLA73DRAFT_188380 [Serpula lacrymans var. lacrymans S7.3]|uniref:Uncharacterized protein n=2 Tax=Serpula lacrymans var. lacrymans TaxID=341189 RepID=F8QB83_SERL3|nr:uncharacterized protein SERLADRAFT_478468 [Serpula lacrymans var. lacrymans S7.9]EGN94469.1 hypothetical protein SERLA73DRAFT_188380 [Serpula lacrymans var. lacrymans S7.3]EGO19948.1 hypothetical protein SERLADRAFT_478468 [Serpula lacrymans var. lacrymans S7.9]